ncbi:MAG: Tim44 domain-containing protein [Proteobacteria bacterium]|nr:Tim44 domain-containing protein [Pseudomonadota bacterium]
MKSLSLMAAVLALGLTLSVPDAEAAKRLGGGTSSGMQRSTTTPDRSAPAAAPAQAPTAAAAKSPATATPAQAQPKRSWMGPIAGLAAGLGLAALASHFGFGEELASMMMIGLLVMAVLVVIGLIMRRRAGGTQPAMAGAGAAGSGMQYAGPAPGARDLATPRTADAAFSGAGVEQPAAAATALPADFDAAAFVRQAKVNFIRLQASNDAANLDDLREFTTPEMFAELKTNILARGTAAQQTDIVQLDAEVLEVVEEASRYIVSVRYSGLIREERDAPPEQIAEIWHLVKPRNGTGGWLLAGIQQA